MNGLFEFGASAVQRAHQDLEKPRRGCRAFNRRNKAYRRAKEYERRLEAVTLVEANAAP